MGDQVVQKAVWYMKWRTTIWGAIWFAVGLFGGNADRIKENIPTLQYQQQGMQQTNEELQQKLQIIKENLEKAKKELDKTG